MVRQRALARRAATTLLLAAAAVTGRGASRPEERPSLECFRMKLALVNPPWRFEGSIYFGCREPHLPLEFGYTAAMLRAAGHEVLLLDGHLTETPAEHLVEDISAFAPDYTVVTTAPSYLFWRCPPPELRVPAEIIRLLDGRGGRVVAVG